MFLSGIFRFMVVWIVLFLFIILLGIMFIKEYNFISFLLLNFMIEVYDKLKFYIIYYININNFKC